MGFFKRAALLSIAVLFAFNLKAQYSISGKITNAETSEELVGANVYLQGTTLGAASDKSGDFQIKGISEGKYLLRVSYFGFETLEQTIEIKSDILGFSGRLKPTSIDLNAVVITGTRTEKTLKNSPVLTQLIGKSAIESQAVTYIPQVLAQSDASFEMYKDNTVSSFSLDGLGAKYVLFLVDGERVSGETKGSVDFSRINPSSIERVEIVKGASSTLYGSNAIGGVVNIITKSVSQPVEVSAGIKASIYNDPSKDETRSDEYYYTNVNLTKGKWSSFTDFKLNNYATYDLNAGAGIYGLLTQEKENNFVINQRVNYRLSNKLEFSAKASYYELNRDYQLVGYADKLSRDFTWGAKANYFASPKAKFELSYYSDRNKIYDVKNDVNDLDYDNRFGNARLLATLIPINKNTLTLGTEYTNEKQSSVQNNITDQTLDNVIVYAQDEYNACKMFTLVGGARMEFHSTYGNHFTPQISAMLSPGKFKIRGGYGQGFRAPTVKELFTNKFRIPAQGAPFAMYLDGNKNLEPENSRYFSGSVQYATDKLDVSLIYSVNEISNLITTDSIYNVVMNFKVRPPMPAEIYYLYSNVEEARISNLNLLVKYRLTNELTLSGSYTYTNPENLTTGNDLLNVRKQNARINLDYVRNFDNYRLTVNFNGSYFGTKTVADIYNHDPKAVNPTMKLSDFTLWKLTSTHTFKNRYTLTAGIENIFGKTDDKPQYFNLTTPGRMFILGLSVSL